MFKVLSLLLISQVTFAEFTLRSELFGAIIQRQWNENSSFNADNRILEIPKYSVQFELRPDIQYTINAQHFLVLRSRHFLQSYQYNFENPKKSEFETLSESDLSDFYFSSQWTNGFSTTIGLQNYQWGPAEIFSPTNPFFHFLNDQRSFFFKEKGRVLFRFNWTPNPETARWSVIGMYEPVNNQTKYWTADRDFKSKSLVKVEYQFENPANQFAFVTGQGENQKEFIGEYFTWSFIEGHSVYADVKHQKSRTNYIPKQNGLGFYDLVKSSEDQRIFSTAVVGYRFEGRVDFRQEFIFNESGFNSDEWSQAKKSALTLSTQLLTNSKRFARPGLEFLTQSYSYTSIRIPDIGPQDQSSLSVRWLSSLEHNSAVLQINLEHNLSDHTVLTAESLHYQGSDSQEFRLAETQQTSLGFRYSF